MRVRLEGNRKLILAGALLVLLAALPWIGNAYYTSLLIVIGIHTLVTVGLCLLMGYTGQVSLGQASFYGVGAFVSGILSATYGVSPWLAMIIAALATGGLAYVTGYPIFRLRGNYLAMGTLGFGIVVYILLVQLDQFTGGPSGLSGIPPLSIGGFAFDNDLKYYYLVWVFCLLGLLLAQNVVRSRVGRALRAIHGSEVAAESLGIDVSQFKIKVFVLSAVYASVAGSLYAHYTTFISPQPFSMNFSVELVVMVVIGGLASIWGAIFGSAAITLLGELLHGFGELDVIVFGLVLIVVMVTLPEGLTRGLLDALSSGSRKNWKGSGRRWRRYLRLGT